MSPIRSELELVFTITDESKGAQIQERGLGQLLKPGSETTVRAHRAHAIEQGRRPD